jgi:hypothetical protein
MQKRLILFLSLVVASLLLACHSYREDTGDNEPAKAVEDTIKAAFAAFNKRDADGFLGYWTDAGFKTTFGAGKEHGHHFFPYGIRFHRMVRFAPFTVEEFSNTVVTGDTATTLVELIEGQVKEAHRMSLVREKGVWKINGMVEIELPIPAGAQVVDVKMSEFKFDFPSGFQDNQVAREIAFKVFNTGKQPHEFGVLVVRKSGAEEFLGRVGPLEPGKKATLILTGLEAGRYAMLCNLLDTQGDGRPHSVKGMRVDFTVQ